MFIIKNRQGNKRVRIALRKIFGIGPTLANQICDILGISDHKVKNLTSLQTDRISYLITNNYFFGHELKKMIKNDIQRLKDIRSFRGVKNKL
jgi:small subunit ribosomal protein S13